MIVTYTPDYIVHEVDEKDVTVDWFFSRTLSWRQFLQFILIFVGWFFAILPIVITTSALTHRNRPGGWWSYSEGFRMWDMAERILQFLIVVFIIVFLSLYILHRTSSRKRNREKTYDEERLARRINLAADMYDDKFGVKADRVRRNKVVIEPYDDVETYELRDLYREYGVDG